MADKVLHFKPKLRLVKSNNKTFADRKVDIPVPTDCSAILNRLDTPVIVDVGARRSLSDKSPPFEMPNKASNCSTPWQESNLAYYNWLKAYSCDTPYKITTKKNSKEQKRVPSKVDGADTFLVCPINGGWRYAEKTLHSQKKREMLGRALKEPSSLIDEWDQYCTHPETSIVASQNSQGYMVVKCGECQGKGWEDSPAEGLKGLLRPPTEARLLGVTQTKRKYFKKNVYEPSDKRHRISQLRKKKYFYWLKKAEKMNGHTDCLPLFRDKHLNVWHCTRDRSILEFTKVAPVERFSSYVKNRTNKWVLFCEYYKAYLGDQIDHLGLEKAGKLIYSGDLVFYAPNLFTKQAGYRSSGHCILEGEYEEIPDTSARVHKEVAALRRMAERRYRQLKEKGELFNRGMKSSDKETQEVVPDNSSIPDISVAKATKNLPSLILRKPSDNFIAFLAYQNCKESTDEDKILTA